MLKVIQIARESGPWHCPMSRSLFPPALVSQTDKYKCMRPHNNYAADKPM